MSFFYAYDFQALAREIEMKLNEVEQAIQRVLERNALAIHRKAHDIPSVCQITSMKRAMVYMLIKDGRLKAKKIGKRTVVLDDDLQDFLDNLPAYHVED